MASAPSPYAPPAAASGSGPGEEYGPGPSPVIAGVLSLFIRGAGHVYACQPFRGIAWAATSVLTTVVLTLVELCMRGKLVLLTVGAVVFLMLFLQLAAIVDVTHVARGAKAARAPLAVVATASFLFFAVNMAGVVASRAVVQAFKIPSGSMMPTLLINDHIFVDMTRRGGRGDVVVFPFPEHPDEDFVKRIVAVPGDRIEFHDSHPIVNGEPVPSCLVGNWSYEENEGTHEGPLYLETISGHTYLAFYDNGSVLLGHQGPWTVNEGEVFVVGDNRNNAYDSRMWAAGKGRGVKQATVLGVALDVWASITEDAVIDWSRGGTSLDGPHLPKSAESLAPQLAQCVAKLATK